MILSWGWISGGGVGGWGEGCRLSDGSCCWEMDRRMGRHKAGGRNEGGSQRQAGQGLFRKRSHTGLSTAAGSAAYGPRRCAGPMQSHTTVVCLPFSGDEARLSCAPGCLCSDSCREATQCCWKSPRSRQRWKHRRQERQGSRRCLGRLCRHHRCRRRYRCLRRRPAQHGRSASAEHGSSENTVWGW